jgi:hypothetical protein
MEQTDQSPLRAAQLQGMGEYQDVFHLFSHLKQSSPKIRCRGRVMAERSFRPVLIQLALYQWME